MDTIEKLTMAHIHNPALHSSTEEHTLIASTAASVKDIQVTLGDTINAVTVGKSLSDNLLIQKFADTTDMHSIVMNNYAMLDKRTGIVTVNIHGNNVGDGNTLCTLATELRPTQLQQITCAGTGFNGLDFIPAIIRIDPSGNVTPIFHYTGTFNYAQFSFSFCKSYT